MNTNYCCTYQELDFVLCFIYLIVYFKGNGGFHLWWPWNLGQIFIYLFIQSFNKGLLSIFVGYCDTLIYAKMNKQ